jgi:hypothetical protein
MLAALRRASGALGREFRDHFVYRGLQLVRVPDAIQENHTCIRIAGYRHAKYVELRHFRRTSWRAYRRKDVWKLENIHAAACQCLMWEL